MRHIQIYTYDIHAAAHTQLVILTTIPMITFPAL